MEFAMHANTIAPVSFLGADTRASLLLIGCVALVVGIGWFIREEGKRHTRLHFSEVKRVY